MEYKFRGISAVSGKMVYGSYASSNHAGTGHIIIAPDGFGHREVTIETVGQFTGLTDNTGKDIYSGDLLSGESKVFGHICGEVKMSSYGDCEEYQHETHLGWNVKGTPLTDLINDGLEVIGNIHLHPELMESDDE